MIVDEFLRSLGIPDVQIRGSLEARTKLYRSLLIRRSLLIVLDNAATPAQVRPLLPGAPTCTVLVTSRTSLSSLIARDGAHRVTLGVLSTGQSVALLRRIIGAKRVDTDLAATTDLARLCAYLPLALRIAAERVIARPHSPLPDLVAELTDERARLDLLSADEDPTTAVRAVFSWSYRALTPAQARMFRLLGLHPGLDIDTLAAAALADMPSHAEQLLDQLTQVHLLDHAAHGRYQFHDLLRLYARERVEHDETPESRQAATSRLLTWYLHAADAADRILIAHHRHVPIGSDKMTFPLPQLTSHSQAMAWCDTERANLVAAIRQASDVDEHVVAWKLPLTLWSYFTLRKPWNDWLATHQIGLASARHLDDRYGEAWLINNVGTAYRQLGKHHDALTHYQQALGLWQQTNDQWGQAHALNNIGEVYQELKQYTQALDYLKPALPIWEHLGDAWGKGSTLVNLGAVHHSLRRFTEAAEYAEQALTTARELDDPRTEGRALSQLGEACLGLGRYDDAVTYCQQALAVRRAIGERWGEARTLFTLGEAHHSAQRPADAREAWSQALVIFNDLRAPFAAEVQARLDAHNREDTN